MVKDMQKSPSLVCEFVVPKGGSVVTAYFMASPRIVYDDMMEFRKVESSSRIAKGTGATNVYRVCGAKSILGWVYALCTFESGKNAPFSSINGVQISDGAFGKLAHQYKLLFYYISIHLSQCPAIAMDLVVFVNRSL